MMVIGIIIMVLLLMIWHRLRGLAVNQVQAAQHQANIHKAEIAVLKNILKAVEKK